MTDELRDAAQQVEREAFEAKWATPTNCTWTGNGYCPTEYRAWSSESHALRWEGWKARAELAQQDVQAVERVGDPVTITRLATLVDEETQRILADSLDLIKQINYMVGIAERGTGKKCPDGERPEVFLLDYVKSLEAALAQYDAQTVPTQRQYEMALRQWDHWKSYALELQAKLVKYEGGSPMVLNAAPEAKNHG